MNLKRILIVFFIFVVLLFICYIFFFHNQQPETEICNNNIDDDSDQTIDCDDWDCYGTISCLPGNSNEYENDPSADISTDSKVKSLSSVRNENKILTKGRIKNPQKCSSESGTCLDECRHDRDCLLVVDFLECCGGYPHQGGDDGEIEVCLTAANKTRAQNSPCVLIHEPNMEIPDPPDSCRPYCVGVRCPPCIQPERSVCFQGQCRRVILGGCLSDDDCSEGFSCIDPDGDGNKECFSGVHECEDDAQCRRRFPECRGCTCLDSNRDELRDCDCWGCGDLMCSRDDDCREHHFCEDRRCVFSGHNACHVGGSLPECSPCETCQPLDPDDGSSRRGQCIQTVDGGIVSDGGCLHP